MDVICVDRRDPTAEEASSARVESLVATWRDTKSLTMAAPAAGDGTKSSLAELEAREVQGVVGSLNRSCVALRLLTRRTLRELTRDKAALIFQYSMVSALPPPPYRLHAATSSTTSSTTSFSLYRTSSSP